jgi:phosphotransferase system HPr (HPr) family protein
MQPTHPQDDVQAGYIRMSGILNRPGKDQVMREARTYIWNKQEGLTVRNAAMLVKMINRSDCNVLIDVNGRQRSAGNILSVLSLGLSRGDIVSIIIEGAEVSELAADIGNLLCGDSPSGMCRQTEARLGDLLPSFVVHGARSDFLTSEAGHAS